MSTDVPRAVPALDIRLPAGEMQDAVSSGTQRAVEQKWATRLFEKDLSLWPAARGRTGDAGSTQAEAGSRGLGWLDLPALFRERVAGLEGFGEGIRDAGFTTAIVCAVGPEARIAEAYSRAFGSIPDWLTVRVLDSPDPAAVARAFDGLEDLETFVVIASKAGPTVETLAFEAEAWQRLETALKQRHGVGMDTPGDLMMAVTDPDPGLRAIPHHDRLHEVFIDPEDVVGRFGALGYAGLVPASLLGIDLDPLLDAAAVMLERCRVPDAAENPGLALGVAIAGLGSIGRNKLTLLADPELEGLAGWVEELVAESTGDGGRGIVVIAGEPPGAVGSYDADRVFVRLSLGEASGPLDELLEALGSAGHPVIRLSLDDPIDLGGEFVRWEVATAVAAAALGVDPFQEPEGAHATERGRGLLERLRGRGEPDAPAITHRDAAAPGPGQDRLAADGELIVFGRGDLVAGSTEPSVADVLARHLERLQPGSVAALVASIAPTAERDGRMASIRGLLRDATHRATAALYGPLHLSSTRELRRAGLASAWVLQVTADHVVDVPVPAKSHTFGDLVDEETAGDFAALDARGVPIVRVHLGPDPDAGLKALEAALAVALLGSRRSAESAAEAAGHSGDASVQTSTPASTSTATPADATPANATPANPAEAPTAGSAATAAEAATAPKAAESPPSTG